MEPATHSRFTRRSLIVGTGLAGAAGMLPALPLAAGSSALAQTAGGSITWAQGRYPLTFNPVDPIGALERWVWQLTSTRLINLDTSATVQPDLAETWEVSEDGLVFTFHLVQDAVWSDGTPVTATDTALTITTAADPRTGSRFPALFASLAGVRDYLDGTADSITGVQASDDHTLVLTMAEPFAPFINSLAGNQGPYLVPAHILGDIAPDDFATSDYNTAPVGRVGAGPYTIASAEVDQNVVFTRSDTYFKGAPMIDQIVFRVMQPDVALAALLTGEIDIASVPGDQYEAIAAEDGVVVTAYPWNLWDGFVFNTTLPQFADTRVREAFVHAIDREAIVEAIFGGLGEVWDSIFAQETFAAPDLIQRPYDPDKAPTLLEEAGWDPNHTVKWKYAGTNNPLAPLFQEMLGTVGVKFEPIGMETAAWVEEVITNVDFELTWTGGNGVLADPADLESFFDCGTNSLYCDEEFTALWHAGRVELDPAKRQEIYNEIQVIVNRDLPTAVLWKRNLAVGMTERVNPTAFSQFDYLSFHTWTVSE